MDKVKADIAAKKTWEDPAYTIEQVQSYISLMVSETEAIFNAPPPKKEEPPKAEEQKADGQAPTDDKANEQPAQENGTGDQQQAAPEGEKPDVEMTNQEK